MTLKSAVTLRCSNGKRCVAYRALKEPAKLSRGNPGPRCFACEERRAAAELKVTAVKSKAVESRAAQPTSQPEGSRSLEILARRKAWVLTCERKLHSAISSADDRLVHKWSKLLREAEARLAWAEADLARTDKRARSA
jgi:hypothetical protein